MPSAYGFNSGTACFGSNCLGFGRLRHHAASFSLAYPKETPIIHLMVWHRTLLAVAFLLATVLGNAAFVSAPTAATVSGMDMGMSAESVADQAQIPEKCNPCTKHDAVTPSCVVAMCAAAGATLPVAAGFNLVSIGLAFDRPADQQVDGPIYTPDPHPPKSRVLA